MRRPLSAPETFIWAGGQLPRNFALVARIHGCFSAEQLHAALAKVRQKDPQVAGRIVVADGVPWYETGSVPPSIRVAAGDWASEAAHELARLFPAHTGPLIRFAILPGGEHTHLIIVCHHCIADGLSAVYLLRDVLHFMAIPDFPVHPLPALPPFEQLLPVAGQAPVQFLAAMPQPVMPDQAPTAGEAGRIYVLPWSLTIAQTGCFAARCREEKASVHAALCAAFLNAFHRLGCTNPAGLHCASSPVSIRDRLRQPVGDRFGLFIHPGIKTPLPQSAADGEFWAQAREIKAVLESEANAPGFWFLFLLGQQMLQMMPVDQAIRFNELPVDYDLSITNLGRLDIPVDYGPFSLEAVYGPLVNSMASEKILGVATVAGRMTFALVAHDRFMDIDTARQVKELAMQQLAGAVNWPVETVETP